MTSGQQPMVQSNTRLNENYKLLYIAVIVQVNFFLIFNISQRYTTVAFIYSPLILLILYFHCIIDRIQMYSFSVQYSLVLIYLFIESSHFNQYFIVCLSML